MELADSSVSRQNYGNKTGLARMFMFVKRRIKLNRFLLVIDIKKGVSISALSVIFADLIDLLWHLSMTFGPMNGTLSSLLLLETFLVISICLTLLYSLKSRAKLDLRGTLFTWLVVIAVDYCVRVLTIVLSLFLSEKASLTAKIVRIVCSAIMFALVAHCWLCVLSYFDEINDKTTTVKITPSDDRRLLRKSMLARVASSSGNQVHDSATAAASSSPLTAGSGASITNIAARANQMAPALASNMLRAPEEVNAANRW